MKLIEAYAIAARVHENQKDLRGRPYIEHVTRVAMIVRERGGSLIDEIAALLHDSIEDGGVTADDLLDMGVPGRAVSLVVMLTRPPSMTYVDYIAGMTEAAAFLKLADISDNAAHLGKLGLTRAKKAGELARKYSQAACFLANKYPELGPFVPADWVGDGHG